MSKKMITNYFPGGNTAQGFYSFYEYLPYGAEKIYIIKGGPGTGKSTFMRKIGFEMVEEGYEIEFHWCSSDNDSLDGVVIPGLKTAFFDGTAPHMIDPVNPGAVEEIINLGEFWDSSHLRRHRQEIITLNNTIGEKFRETYQYLKIAKLIHDQWESFYITGMDFDKANLKTSELIKQILGNKPVHSSGSVRHLFGSAITPEGPVNFFENITEDIEQRFIIKGRPGTGKSTMARRVAEAIRQRGFDLLYLHCSFDPDSIDGVIVPETGIALLDGTSPHIMEATRDGDQIIDMFTCVKQEVIKKREIENTEKEFKATMDKAFQHLKKAKLTHDQLEEFYVTAMDFDQVEAKRMEIMKEIVPE